VVIHGGIPHIRGNHIFSNSGKGLYLEGLSGGEIEENHIESNISNGIYLDGLNGGVITGNIVENNNSYGIYGLNGCMNVDLTYNSIFDNDDEGIYLFDDCRNFEILHNIIYGNGYYGIRIKDCAVVNPSVYIKYNTIYENSYDGIYSDNSKTQVINNTIAYNLRHGVFCFNGNLTIYNNIIAENENKGIYIQNITVYPDYNDFWLNAQGDYFGCNPGFHDLNADPLFIDANAGDYNLSEGSPCIDAGNPLYIYNDPDGTRNDMGAWYFFQDIVVQPGKDEAPTSYNLLTGHPNPFNQVVDLNLFLLPGFAPSGELEIFDISGRLVNAISLNPAVTNYRWNGVDFTGRSLPSGIYICRTEFTKSLRLILLK
jgi:parallel beta-helix repeat protein